VQHRSKGEVEIFVTLYIANIIANHLEKNSDEVMIHDYLNMATVHCEWHRTDGSWIFNFHEAM